MLSEYQEMLFISSVVYDLSAYLGGGLLGKWNSTELIDRYAKKLSNYRVKKFTEKYNPVKLIDIVKNLSRNELEVLFLVIYAYVAETKSKVPEELEYFKDRYLQGSNTDIDEERVFETFDKILLYGGY